MSLRKLKKIPQNLIVLWIIIFKEISTENILKQIESWETGVYFGNGSPNLTKERIYENVKNYTFTPRYFIIKSELQREGNVYISLYYNITEINFRIYGEKYPDYPNYKFNVTSNEIEICSNLNNCHPLYICQVAVGDAVLDENTIFLSWRLVKEFNGSNLTLLFQYKHRIVKCIDSNPKNIKKIVLEGKNSQQVQSTSLFYKYKKTPNSSSVKLDLKNSSVAIYVTHGKNCEFMFNLRCNGENISSTKNITTLSNFTASDVFNTDVTFRGWKKIVLPSPSTNKTSCNLDIITINNEAKNENENAMINNHCAIAFIDPTEERYEAEGPNNEESTTEQPNTETLKTSTGESRTTDTSASIPNETCDGKKNVAEPVECVLTLFNYFLRPVKTNNRTVLPDDSKSCPWKAFAFANVCCLLLIIIFFGVSKAKTTCCRRN